MLSGLTPSAVCFLVRHPSVVCVKPQLARCRLNQSLRAVQLKSKFAEFMTTELQERAVYLESVCFVAYKYDIKPFLRGLRLVCEQLLYFSVSLSVFDLVFFRSKGKLYSHFMVVYYSQRD